MREEVIIRELEKCDDLLENYRLRSCERRCVEEYRRTLSIELGFKWGYGK